MGQILDSVKTERGVLSISLIMALVSTYYSFSHNYITSYGDAESHLNIAKRVVDSITPGFAQLGGIWLPLPHIFLIPFVKFDFLWHTGLAGSIVSGTAFVIASIFIYKLASLLTHNKDASFFAALVFILNPNILYLQSTPMTELTLIVFFVLSSYYFIRFLIEKGDISMLMLAAFFGLCASLSRYDGWALVMMEAGVICLYYFPFTFKRKQQMIAPSDNAQPVNESFRARWSLLEGRFILFATLAFFGIFLWLLWSFLILGDPLYFTHSEFSANSQQKGWNAKGQLPAFHHPLMSFLYYLVTVESISGILPTIIAIIGMILFLANRKSRNQVYILLIMLVPFIFNVLTLYMGQSIIFIPSLTPSTFEWTLFNVRYGVMMLPAIALFSGYLFYRTKTFGKLLISGLLILQCLLFFIGYSQVLALTDGVSGLSSATAKSPDAQHWLENNYDYGQVLMDDYKRTLSVIRTPIHMRDIIYIGNKPYWEESLAAPEKYARWIIIQRNDELWDRIYQDPVLNGRLYKYFSKVYTSDEILIFERNDLPA